MLGVDDERALLADLPLGPRDRWLQLLYQCAPSSTSPPLFCRRPRAACMQHVFRAMAYSVGMSLRDRRLLLLYQCSPMICTSASCGKIFFRYTTRICTVSTHMPGTFSSIAARNVTKLVASAAGRRTDQSPTDQSPPLLQGKRRRVWPGGTGGGRTRRVGSSAHCSRSACRGVGCRRLCADAHADR